MRWLVFSHLEWRKRRLRGAELYLLKTTQTSDGWMASLIHWTWTWANSGRWWGTEKPGTLQFTGSQGVGHNLATKQQHTHLIWTQACLALTPLRTELFKTVLRFTHWWSCYKTAQKEFPGGLVVRILGFYCRGLQFKIWSGNWRSYKPHGAKNPKINKQNHTDTHTCPRKHTSAGSWIQPIFCCSSFSYFSFFLLCSMRKRISLLRLIIITHRVEFWPSKGGCLRSRFSPCLISWAWWWVQVLWDADPEACT